MASSSTIFQTHIHRLNASSSSLIQSTSALCTIAEAAEQLLLNGIDAGATDIELRLHWASLSITVTDNGRGIHPNDFHLLGVRSASGSAVGTANSSAIKRRGASLCNLIALSSGVDIVSRSSIRSPATGSFERSSSSSHTTATFHNGARVSPPGGSVGEAGKEVFFAGGRSGTVVRVAGLFAATPVRQKLVSPRVDGDRVLERLTRLALVHPGLAFCYYEVDEPSRLRGELTGVATDWRCSFRLPAAVSVIGRVAALYGASLAASLLPLDSDAPCNGGGEMEGVAAVSDGAATTLSQPATTSTAAAAAGEAAAATELDPHNVWTSAAAATNSTCSFTFSIIASATATNNNRKTITW